MLCASYTRSALALLHNHALTSTSSSLLHATESIPSFIQKLMVRGNPSNQNTVHAYVFLSGIPLRIPLLLNIHMSVCVHL